MSRAQHPDHQIDHLYVGEKRRLWLASTTIAVRYQDLAVTACLVDDPRWRVAIMQLNIAMWGEHALDHGGEVQLVSRVIGVDGCSRPASVPQAAAIWLCHDQLDSPPPLLPHRYRERLVEDCGQYASRFAELDEKVERHRPRDRGPHHQLAFLAAARPGLGPGTALLRHHLPILDTRRFGAYLVAGDERSRDLYARYGFQTLDRVLELPSAEGRGRAHVMFPMWRDPCPPQPGFEHAGGSQPPEWSLVQALRATALPELHHGSTAITLDHPDIRNDR